jgi:hypothetical protein
LRATLRRVARKGAKNAKKTQRINQSTEQPGEKTQKSGLDSFRCQPSIVLVKRLKFRLAEGERRYTFPTHSFTVLHLE